MSSGIVIREEIGPVIKITPRMKPIIDKFSSRSVFYLPVISLALLLYCTHVAADLNLPALDDDPSTEVDGCQACRLVVTSFEKGLDETARGKHEGGDTSWEEKNLKNYADSEVRLVEIQEKICEDVKKGKAQCLSLAEDTESEVEEWYFKHRNKKVRLLDYLCISKLKVCCPSSKYGPNCQPCPSECNNHGTCDGVGTRRGTGKCFCDQGYAGEECEKCSENHFSVATKDYFTCLKCDSSCNGCYGLGSMNCTECRSGYYKHATSGCVDVNECDLGMDTTGSTRLCRGNTYCVNTDGAYKCADCHMSCSGCVGYGPNMCLACAPGYQLDEDYTCQSEEDLADREEFEGEDSWMSDKAALNRYLFYLGIFCVSLPMFRVNLYVMSIYTILFTAVLWVSEFYPRISEAMATLYGGVQRQDWQDRDFIEIISRNIKKISDFLNHFDQSCRGKLAELNEKVTNLERQMEFLEASISGATNHAAVIPQPEVGYQVNNNKTQAPQHP